MKNNGLNLSFIIAVLLILVSCVDKKENNDTAEVKLAQTPPMGWNSFDSYGVYLYHDAALANLEAMAEKLKPHGYEYFVIDAGWFGEFKLREGTMYPTEKHAEKLNLDEYGIYQPSKTYFPHGFESIISRCKELGLKFGVHLMRGIPRVAVEKNLPIKGTGYFASDIADTSSICVWNPQNYGVDMSKPGAQEYYNSVINEMAEWGVDFIKYDDIVPHPREVDAVVKAIENCGRPIILSLSPGGRVDVAAVDTFKRANMLRVTSDIWDEQEGIDQAFAAWKKWQGEEKAGFWIDMDMIPFGQLQIMSPLPEGLEGDETKQEITRRKIAGELSNVEFLSGKGWHRWSEFTNNQAYTFITLRALAASPLMMGGDLPTLDDFSLSLITNEEMIKCNQNGVMGYLVTEENGFEIWNTEEKNSNNGWVGIFNRNDSPEEIKFTADKLGLNADHEYRLYDIWNEKEINNEGEYEVGAEGVVFVRYEGV